ncbi:MAG: OB-fold nucleic acid binding domain-containing protein [Candidatus Aenigmarchaeota archaeon]|nr:OB-fold nucleic acid binding domain-containing protein [Candidatus Aenigmarchaeota archaeon]
MAPIPSKPSVNKWYKPPPKSTPAAKETNGKTIFSKVLLLINKENAPTNPMRLSSINAESIQINTSISYSFVDSIYFLETSKLMKIKDIKVGMSNINVEAGVVDKSDSRSVQTKYGRREVADVLLEDDTGRIKASLWEDQIEKANVGDKVKISEAYVTEFRGELQLNIPTKGSIETIK